MNFNVGCYAGKEEARFQFRRKVEKKVNEEGVEIEKGTGERIR